MLLHHVLNIASGACHRMHSFVAWYMRQQEPGHVDEKNRLCRSCSNSVHLLGLY